MNHTNQKFNDLLVEELSEGFGLAPFIGSGCSSPSGIIMGEEFSNYLAHAVFRCVCDPTSQAPNPNQPAERWNLLKSGWPEEPTDAQTNRARSWVMKVFTQRCDELGLILETDSDGMVTTLIPKQNSSGAQQWNLSESEQHLHRIFAPEVPQVIRSRSFRGPSLATQFIKKSLTQNVDPTNRAETSGKSPTSYAAICEQAVHSLSDWRSTLKFLSSLRLSDDGLQIGLAEPNQAVVDRFNVWITKGRRPNQIHRMLAQLAVAARIRTLFTTNFDELVESAFKELDRDISTIPIGISDPLPHPDTIHERDCLLKLHGDCHQTRADFSLDESPTQTDRNRFFTYIRGHHPPFAAKASWGPGLIPSQLLVLGYSGRDRRCNELMKFILDNDQDAKIYWVCYSSGDLARVKSIFHEPEYQNGRVCATITERTDLLLYDLFQRLTLTLPSAGRHFQFTERVIPKSSDRTATVISRTRTIQGKDPLENDLLALKTALLQTYATEDQTKIVTLRGESGALRVLNKLFNDSQVSQYKRAWFELEDYPDSISIASELQILLSAKTGRLALQHKKPLPDKLREHRGKLDDACIKLWCKYYKQTCQTLGIDPSSWIIGFYGRNGPGVCSGWKATSGWKDAEYREFWALILGLSKCGFRIVYTPYDAARQTRAITKKNFLSDWLSSTLKSDGINARSATAKLLKSSIEGLGECPVDHIVDNQTLHSDRRTEIEFTYRRPEQISYETIVINLWKLIVSPDNLKITKNEDCSYRVWVRQIEALHSTTFFRQSRHFSAFFTDSLFPCPYRFNLLCIDNDKERACEIRKWLMSLTDIGVFQIKAGGFAWAYQDIRLATELLSRTAIEIQRKRDGNSTSLRPIRASLSRTHFHIASWYERAHRITKHTTPLIEGLYHYYRSLEFFDNSAPKKSRDGSRIYKQHSATRSLVALNRLIDEGGETLRYWLPDEKIDELFRDFPPQTLESEIDKQFGKNDSEADRNYTQTLRLALSYRSQFLRRETRRSTSGRVRHAVSSWFALDATSTDAQKYFDYAIAARRPKCLVDLFEACEPIAWLRKLRMKLTESHRSADKNEIPHVFFAVELLKALEVYLERVSNEMVKKGASITTINFNELVYDATSKVYFAFIKDQIRSQGNIFNAAQILVEISFIICKKVKADAVVAECERQPLYQRSIVRSSNSTALSAASSFLQNVSFDLCKLIMSGAGHDEVLKLETKSLTLYGLSLGYLSRFEEAKRRISEARALARSCGHRGRRVSLGITALRRAETLLLEARENRGVFEFTLPVESVLKFGSFDSLKKSEIDVPSFSGKKSFKLAEENVLKKYHLFRGGSDSLKIGRFDGVKFGSLLQWSVWMVRTRQAMINDAWRSLEEARRMFTDATHSRRWWFELYKLELDIFGEALAVGLTADLLESIGLKGCRFRMMMCRTRRDASAHLRKTWEMAIEVAGDSSLETDSEDILALEEIFNRLSAHRALLKCLDSLTLNRPLPESKECFLSVERAISDSIESMIPRHSRSSLLAKVSAAFEREREGLSGGKPPEIITRLIAEIETDIQILRLGHNL